MNIYFGQDIITIIFSFCGSAVKYRIETFLSKNKN